MAAADGVVPYAHGVHSAEVDFTKELNVSNLKGKTVLITGGASGLGAGFFTTWAPHGATIIIGDRNESAGKALVNEVSARTGNQNLHFLQLDVTDWQSQVAFFRESCKLSLHGGIDCVIANAGISNGPESEAFENPPDYQSMDNPSPPRLSILDVNLTGVMYTTHLASSYLPRNPGSKRCSVDMRSDPRDRHLILVSSLAGVSALPTQSIYCVSKHGVVGLFRALRITAPITHGIRVNMINPYFVVTPILGMAGAAVMAGGGVAETEDVVAATTRLVTDQSIIGRGLAIGPKASAAMADQAGLKIAEAEKGLRAVWDIHAHDFEQTDIFTRRLIGVTNLVTNLRGIAGVVHDLAVALISPIRRLFAL